MQIVNNMQAQKKIPYGISDFEYVISGNYYYVDKTMYIPELEDQPNNLMFIRPRIEAMRQGAQLHKFIIQFCGWEMVRVEEVQ